MFRAVLVRLVLAGLFLIAFIAYVSPWGPFGDGNTINHASWWLGVALAATLVALGFYLDRRASPPVVVWVPSAEALAAFAEAEIELASAPAGSRQDLQEVLRSVK